MGGRYLQRRHGAQGGAEKKAAVVTTAAVSVARVGSGQVECHVDEAAGAITAR